ncbi:MmgE/PrpD family protein [Paracoccus sp. (in: a-proteobacteria)]|uniref:MmgE/PrpD family protein n=1 Tax=Paracoccus sp. TaxID=267 RepID=UPI002AFF312D|nr:MmgE/PrpD family protein [Paracoccus sp. (in: a-proteobacteria)]
MSGLTSLIAERSCANQLDHVPEAAQIWAKRAIIDTIGCGLAGASEPVVQLLSASLSDGAGEALVFGSSHRRSIFDAAQINGAAAHALDFDDCHLIFDGHPTVPIVPALFALADRTGASGADLLNAYITGVEAEVRIAQISSPAHLDHGWHPTASLGVLGAAIACGRLLNLTVPQMQCAIGIAASTASGLRASSGTMTKPLHAGMANRNGLQAAWLASLGFTANPTTLEHKMGYFTAFNGGQPENGAAAFDDWGQHYTILDPGIAIKQYPCCAFTHCSIDAACAVRAQGGFTPDEIAKIRIRIHPRRRPNVDRPIPKSGLDGKFSTQYLIARALLAGTVVFDDFDDAAVQDPQVLALTRKVEMSTHDEADLSLGQIEVELTDGRILTAGASVAMGRGPENPMSLAQVEAKFATCANRLLPPETTKCLFDMLWTLEALPHSRSVTERIAKG